MRYYEDLSVGDEAEFGQYEMTREEIIEFATKYDPQPFHLSEEGGKTSIFGGLCASGWHTCAATMRMMVEEMTKQQTAGLGSPGIDELQWLKPVFPGDVLRVKTTILGKSESKKRPQIGFIKNRYEVFNQKDEMVMRFTGNFIIQRREQG
ncbi:MAG: MaoC family dehydratase [Sphingomonadales bacterium]|jgi:acyl dehydratase